MSDLMVGTWSHSWSKFRSIYRSCSYHWVTLRTQRLQLCKEGRRHMIVGVIADLLLPQYPLPVSLVLHEEGLRGLHPATPYSPQQALTHKLMVEYPRRDRRHYGIGSSISRSLHLQPLIQRWIMDGPQQFHAEQEDPERDSQRETEVSISPLRLGSLSGMPAESEAHNEQVDRVERTLDEGSRHSAANGHVVNGIWRSTNIEARDQPVPRHRYSQSRIPGHPPTNLFIALGSLGRSGARGLEERYRL